MTDSHARCLVAALLVAAMNAAGCRPDRAAPPPPKPPVVTISQPVERPYQPHEEFTGNMSASESVDIRARVSGYLDKVFFEPGVEVKVGDPLYQIDPRPFKAEVERAKAQLAAAEVASRQASIEFSRMEDLYQKESATQIEYDRQQSLKETAAADVLGAKAALERAQLDLDYSLIASPLTGRISRTKVDPGNLIQGQGQSTLLTNVVTLDPIYVYFDVDELTMLRLVRRKGPDGRANRSCYGTPVFLGLADEQDFPHEGKIDFVENQVDPETGTLRVRAVFANADRLLVPGIFVRVRVHTGQAATVSMVTERALGLDQGQRFVYLVNDKNVVEYRRIEVGPLDGELRVIERGVEPTEWVIVNGLQRVRPGSAVTAEKVDMMNLVAQPAGVEAVSTGGSTADNRPSAMAGQ